MFKKKKQIYLDVKEFREKLKIVRKYYNVNYTDPDDGLMKWNAYIADKISRLELTFKDPDNNNKPITYIFDKSCSINTHEYLGMQTYSTLQKYFKIPHVADKVNAKFSVAGILYHNPKYDGTRQHAYGYDMNSAFSWGMIQDMPKDTDKGPINYDEKLQDYKTRKIKKGEIGFELDGTLRFPGEYGNYIFKTEESPFKRFVEKWYQKKRDAKNKKEKTAAKDMLVMCVGFMQRHNFWYRAAIIGYCNRKIQSIIKKYPDNVLISNTDSIISNCRIPELEADIGIELGQWKFEHEGEFAYISSNYQWDLNTPTFRGMSKSWFKKDYDLLKDGVPPVNNYYVFDRDKCDLIQVREVQNG